MPSRGVIRREKRNHSNLRPKHKHTKTYLQHYWPYLPMVTLVLVGLWLVRPSFLRSSPHNVLSVATNVSNQTLLSETNKARQDNSKQALQLNPQLSAAAQAKAQDMVTRNYWAHNTPDGSPPWTFIVNSGYQYQKAGENLAYGFTTSSDTITGWMNSPSHRENLLDGDFVDVGFGEANSTDFNHSGSTTVVVAMYGRSSKETPVIAVVSPSSTENPTPVNTAQKAAPTTEAKGISRLYMIAGDKLPWLTSAASFLMGAALAIFIFKHGFGVKKALKKGEKFVVTHPMLDVVLVSVILLGLIVTQQIGVIL
jgi:hypothetical protein